MSLMPAPNPATPRDSSIPARAGIGLKPRHFDTVQATRPDTGWFEVHPENYLVAGGPLLRSLERIRQDYPLSFHSVGMSLGSADGIDTSHIQRLKTLYDRFQPGLVSDHLSWSRWQHTALNDLLPMPYTRESLNIMVNNVDAVQTFLGRSIAIENPSSYCNFSHADFDEVDFLVELARRTGAGILLDINNVYVSANNHGWSARQYLERIPAFLVREIHLAGHKREPVSDGVVLIDDHGSTVCNEVWELYKTGIDLFGRHPTLIEWDTDVPDFDTLYEEAIKAEVILQPAQNKLQAAGASS